MSSNSNTSSTSSTETTDARQVVDNGAIAVGGESTVYIDQIPDELIEMTGELVSNITSRAISTVGSIAAQETNQDRSENAQLIDTVLKFGIPAAAIAFVMTR